MKLRGLTLPNRLRQGAKRLFGFQNSSRLGATASLRPDQVWGSSDVFEGVPSLSLYENVVMLPQYWGLFDEGGELIMSSAFCRTSEPQIVGAPPSASFDLDELQIIEEELLYGGTLHAHFGHLLCTGLSRAWAFHHRPDLRVMIHPNNHMSFSAALKTGLGQFCFRKLGIAEERVFQPEKPTIFRKIWIPSSAFDEQWRGYDAFREMSLTLGDGYVGRTGGPVYLSKTRLKVTPHTGLNRVINEIEIETHLARHGVEIIYPEQLSIEEQIGLFASGRTIAGLTGSAFHMHIFAPAVGRVIGLQATVPMISNQLILDKLAGRKAEYFTPIQPSEELDANMDDFVRTVKIEDPQGVAKALMKVL